MVDEALGEHYIRARSMGTIEYLKGDATAPVGDGTRIICHVCNDVGGWGRGFVVAISQRWPQPESEYRAWYKSRSGFTLGAVRLVQVEPELWVANMIAQRDVRPIDDVPPIRYDALRACLTDVAQQAQRLAASVHMPRIGCGLAGGSWPEVEAIVHSTLCTAEVPVRVYDP